MANVEDTVTRILTNIEGETKTESHSAEEALAIYDRVAEELSRRGDRLRPNVEAMAEDRAKLAASFEDEADFPVSTVAEPKTRAPRTPRVVTAVKPSVAPASDLGRGNGIDSGPHGDGVTPVVAQPKNTPATKTESGFSPAGGAGTNDLD